VVKLSRFAGRIGCTALVAGLVATAAHSQDEPASAEDFNIPEDVQILGNSDPNMRRATAMVNGTIITGTEVDQRVALIVAASGSEIPAEEMQRLRMQVFRNLIDETLQIQEARALEMAVTPAEVDETFNRLVAERFNGSADEASRYLASINSSVDSLKRQIEGEMAWERLLRRNVQPFVNVSSDEVNELFERTQASRGAAEYRVGEIFLSATPATRAAVAENAQRIVDQLRQGASFAGYARQFSEASTAAVGGDLGWIRVEQLQNPALEQIARELEVGQLAGPVEIPGGFDILLLIDKRQVGMADPRDAVVSLKQIAVEIAPGTPEAEARATVAAFAEGVQKIGGCGEADATAAALGATVVTNDEIQVRTLPEALQGVILQLNVGQVTPPFGALDEGVRVLMLCGRDDPEETGGPDRDALMAQIENDRINKRAQRYLRDLRRDAVIEYN
jgi:peptidyl-prolyl cis-trans isomerase SurA